MEQNFAPTTARQRYCAHAKIDGAKQEMLHVFDVGTLCFKIRFVSAAAGADHEAGLGPTPEAALGGCARQDAQTETSSHCNHFTAYCNQQSA